MDLSSQVEVVESQIRECYGRVVWTHKTHEKCADILNKRHGRIKFWQILLSALITTGILVAVFGESQLIGLLSALLSFLLTVLNTYTKQYDLGGIAQKHAEAALSIWNVRENYLSLLTDIKSGSVSIDEIMHKRQELQNDLYEIYKGAPRTISKGYDDATKGLKNNEELTFSDAEIDLLLPRLLRKAEQCL
jgi:hypothetical protein